MTNAFVVEPLTEAATEPSLKFLNILLSSDLIAAKVPCDASKGSFDSCQLGAVRAQTIKHLIEPRCEAIKELYLLSDRHAGRWHGVRLQGCAEPRKLSR